MLLDKNSYVCGQRNRILSLCNFFKLCGKMCFAQIMVLRNSSYDEDDTPNLLDFVREATLVLEANDDTEDQGQEIEPTLPLNIESKLFE